MSDAKRRIHSFDFQSETMPSGAKTHVALVDKAANLTEALVMKSTYITTSSEIESYGDDGGYSCDRHVTRVRDHGGDTIYVTEEVVSVIETSVPKINVI